MRVRMLANVGLLETGQEYVLPDEQANNYIRLEYAEEIKPPRAEAKPPAKKATSPAGKPGGARATKAVEAAPENKTAKKAAPSKPDAKTEPPGGAGAEESG